jgi:linoleoyl-CoA desaturase
MEVPRFANPKISFQAELRRRITAYFKENNLKETGNFRLYSKAIILILVFAALYLHLVFFTPSALFAVFECILLGATISGIGFNIMHDGAHGSFSTKNWLNEFAAFSLDFLGGSAMMWKIKHNQVHHTYTNIDGYDEDIDARPFLRLSPSQKKYFFHRFQHFYFLILYSLLYLFWVYFSDFNKYFSGKILNFNIKKLSIKEHFMFWFSKLLYFSILVLVPVLLVGWKYWMIGYIILTATAGVILSIVFQLAHTVEETSFPVVSSENMNVEDEWAIHQLKTTANFATQSSLVTWYVGGLNFQVEHHLFPRISHIHYPALNKIVKDTCKEFGAPYYEAKTMWSAFLSHCRFIRKMGIAV